MENKEKTIQWGIFLRMNVTTIEKNEEIMKKFIRYCKNKYSLQEYAGCLEKSLEGYLHNHLYVNQYLPLKEINKKWNELSEFTEDKGNIYMIKVKNEEHKANILKYIWKAPLRTWVCQSYKDKYGWQTGGVTEKKEEKIEIISENRTISTRFDEESSVTEVAASEQEALKKIRGDRGFKEEKFICAEHKREISKIYKKQIDLEKDLIVIKSYEDFRKKGGRNYKQNLKVLKKFVKMIEPYIIIDDISKNMNDNLKEVMLLNLVYIGIQLQNCKEDHYMYFKIGEKIFKYYDINKNYLKIMIENNQDKIKNKKKITKSEWKMLYNWFYSSKFYPSYKEQLIQVGVKYFSILKHKFYDIKEVLYQGKIIKSLSMKLEIENQIKNIINISKVKKYKYKLPLIEKPIEWGPEEKDLGGYHSEELRKALVKENINEGHELIFNYKRIYPIINKLQSIEYKINKEWLHFVLSNKEKIFDILLKDLEKDSVAYKTKREQFDITLNIASYMSNYEKFYFIYDLDYRGRIYPLQEYLNYQGNLLARSLIQWFNAKEKVDSWLKIANISLYEGVLGKTYEDLLLKYKKNMSSWEFENWEDYIKEAKEPILWLNLFFELSYNTTNMTYHIIWFDATCSGSQLISLLVNEDTYLKYLNLTVEGSNKIYDYYTFIYEQYGKIKNIDDKYARKIVKKTIMTVNYGLSRIGCHRKIFPLLKEYKYCKDWKDYKENWQVEINKFYTFITQLPLVMKLQYLQEIWNYFADNNMIYQFVVGEHGIMVDNENNIFMQNKMLKDYIFKVKTITYKKYYKNLSIYSKTSKMKEKGYKYLWHHNRIDKREQKRKIKANIIHMLDAVWNILICEKFKHNIATIHDCHGIHTKDIDEYFIIVKDVLITMFQRRNQYHALLKNMLMDCKYNFEYKEIVKDFLDEIYVSEYRFITSSEIWKWWSIRRAKYLFITK